MSDAGAHDVRITPLRLARMTLPDFHPAAPGFDTVYGFVVRDGAHCVLVDTGVGADSALIDQLYAPEPRDLDDALAEAGTSAREITAVVNSHLHFDHCGNNARFAGVPIFVQRAELEAARARGYTVPGWVEFPGARYEPVDGRHRLSPALELVPTPGHTPGHQSLVACTADGIEIVVAQATCTAAELADFARSVDAPAREREAVREPHLSLNATWSRDAYAASVERLLGERPQRAYFSHDPVVWTP